MKYILFFYVIGIFLLPVVLATDVGIGITPDIGTEDFEPLVWGCDSRVVYDDNTEPGRITAGGEGVCTDSAGTPVAAFANNQADCLAAGSCTTIGGQTTEAACLAASGAFTLLVLPNTFTATQMTEREHNYAFEGEQVQWNVLVMDKNGINKIEDVFATIGATQGAGNDIEVNCVESAVAAIDPSCNARIGEEILLPADWNPAMMRNYVCTFTVETVASMDGEYWITVEATDLDGLSGVMAENEYWYFNPTIGISIDGDLDFEDVRPGTAAYSTTLLIGNDADDGSGVMMDMFISGTDFYDQSSSGAMCPTTNQLSLSAFNYYATSGAYSTAGQSRVQGAVTLATADAEGYLNIPYGIGFNNPNPFYGMAEIIPSAAVDDTTYSTGNVLSPGSEMAVTFRLMLPEPCNGDFDSGNIYFWGEAV
jgi:hypothetical protein